VYSVRSDFNQHITAVGASIYHCSWRFHLSLQLALPFITAVGASIYHCSWRFHLSLPLALPYTMIIGVFWKVKLAVFVSLI